MVSRAVPRLLALCLLVSTAHAAAPGGATRTALGALPATFTGFVPCEDCAGIRYQIHIMPRGTYTQRRTYLRNGQDVSTYELGRWTLSSDGRKLRLTGGRDGDAYWAVRNARTLRRLDADGNAVDSTLAYELVRNPGAEPFEPRVKLKGMFRTMADAPRFRDCDTGLQWPVAMSDDYLALERAYVSRHAGLGSELLVSVHARIVSRRGMDGSSAKPTLVVEKFLRAHPGEACETPVQGGIENTRWRVTQIAGRAVTLGGQLRDPWIELDPRARRVTGFAGCNRFTGSYEAGGGTLRFGPLAASRMACPAIESEMELLHALEPTRAYRRSGRTLELLDDRGRTLLRLEAPGPR